VAGDLHVGRGAASVCRCSGEERREPGRWRRALPCPASRKPRACC
jgi:hypothetical protein